MLTVVFLILMVVRPCLTSRLFESQFSIIYMTMTSPMLVNNDLAIVEIT